MSLKTHHKQVSIPVFGFDNDKTGHHCRTFDYLSERIVTHMKKLFSFHHNIYHYFALCIQYHRPCQRSKSHPQAETIAPKICHQTHLQKQLAHRHYNAAKAHKLTATKSATKPATKRSKYANQPIVVKNKFSLTRSIHEQPLFQPKPMSSPLAVRPPLLETLPYQISTVTYQPANAIGA